MPGCVPVTFAPGGSTVQVESGVTVAEAARAAGVLLAAPCAGRGVCGGCAIRVLSGTLAAPDDVESRALRRAPEGLRLACRARVIGPVEVRPLFAADAATGRALAHPEVLRAASPDRAPAMLVAGVDLGTTSVAALLVDASSGQAVGRASVPNQQQTLGADVLARISAALAGQADELRGLAEESVRTAIAAAAAAEASSTADITRVVVAGNSAMSALVAGDDVGSLAAHPFTPPTPGGTLAGAASRLVAPTSAAEVILVPPIAAFVGGDALAATVAAGLIDSDSPRLLVDIGTNAEIVLAREGGLLVASTAAGPAFEGAGLTCGGPAQAGAVERVSVCGSDVSLRTIGDAAPVWLSGAGLISAVSALRGAGHIGADGLMSPTGPLEERFERDADGVLGVTLSAKGEARIRLTQLDVRALQLAKAAVRVGIESVLAQAQLTSAELAEVLVAGAFGAALDPADLVALGVLPSGGAQRTRRIGNAALEGAAAIALDPDLLGLAQSAARNALHVDLAAQASFGESFLRATEFLPYDV